MDFPYYTQKFEAAVRQLNATSFTEKQLEIKTGIWLESVVLKLQKKTWANNPDEVFKPGPSIFFSVWIGDQSLKEGKLLYNIHAFKLRKLKKYAIESRKFATAFRTAFKKFEDQWPNVDTKFGPLTLMEGWIVLNEDTLSRDIAVLAQRFSAIDYLVDDAMDMFKKE